MLRVLVPRVLKVLGVLEVLVLRVLKVLRVLAVLVPKVLRVLQVLEVSSGRREVNAPGPRVARVRRAGAGGRRRRMRERSMPYASRCRRWRRSGRLAGTRTRMM